jgi:hypothetical protein
MVCFVRLVASVCIVLAENAHPFENCNNSPPRLESWPPSASESQVGVRHPEKGRASRISETRPFLLRSVCLRLSHTRDIMELARIGSP